jgi:3',5'-nucleoside bisphosphate phosphatase
VIDLHVHTTHSDGRLDPSEAVRESVASGLAAVAITDHDVVTGVAPALAAAAGQPIEVVAGIEMTASGLDSRRAVHVLGYFIDPAEPRLLAALQRARRLMAAHVDHVLAEVRAAGGSLEHADLGRYRHRYAGGAALVLGMLERGVLKKAPPGTGMRLLRLAAAEPRAYSAAEAVELIHAAGGVASLAHPAKLRRGSGLLSADELRPLVEAARFDALEAWQWIPNGWGSAHYQQVAAELGVLVTGGSDDHGKRGPHGELRLGRQPIPLEVLEALRARSRRSTPR